MARCHCRWRRVLLCLCTPCIILALLFIYVTVAVCTNMATISTAIPAIFQQTHFISPGAVTNSGFAPIPSKSFWDPEPHGGALWNQLQVLIDHQYNPILRPRPAAGAGSGASERYSRPPSDTAVPEIRDPGSRMADFDKLPRQMRDFVRSMHQRQYPVLIQPPEGCGVGAKVRKGATLLLLVIKTEEANFANRQAIRQTWGRTGLVAGERRPGGFVRRVFLLGKNPAASALNMTALLDLESRHYRDLLQWDFQDTFFNLTLKDVLFWDWFSRRCPRTVFIFKGDDDVLVRTPALLDYLQKQRREARGTLQGFMAGDVIGAATPVKEATHKYYVPVSFYKGLYPAYAGGGGVVYSGLLAKRLGQVSRRVHLFPIDDVFVGMCLFRLGGNPVHHPAFLTFDFPKKEEKQPCRYHTILVVHKRSPVEVTQIWAELKETRYRCRNATLRVDEDDRKPVTKKPQIHLDDI